MLPRICVGNRVQREKGAEKGQEREKFCLIPVETESLEDSAEFKIIFCRDEVQRQKARKRREKRGEENGHFFT